MNVRLAALLIGACCLFHPSLNAQKSSKTKAMKKLYEKGNEVDIKNALKINTRKVEFSPSFYQDGIVFAASGKSAKGGKADDVRFFELFFSRFDRENVPLKPEAFSLKLNSRLHEGPVTFSRDGETVYFTRSNSKKGFPVSDEEGVTRLKIYEAKKGYLDWENVRELPFNNDEYSCMHPTLSADGQELYFASDMDGGYGGYDLYVSKWDGKKWGIPKNLGGNINTPRNEVFPFIHSSKNLFFASNGYEGAGGLDIYMIDLKDRKQDLVTNLGEPFNSPKDDLGLILSPDGLFGFFTSNRKGGRGQDDIYRFEVAKGILGRTAPSSIEASIQVYDAANQAVIKGAEIRIFERTADGLVSQKNNQLYEAVLLPEGGDSEALFFQSIRKDKELLGSADLKTNRRGKASYNFTGEKKYLILITKDGYKSKERSYTTIGNIGEKIITIPMRAIECSDLSGRIVNAQGEALKDAVVRIKNICNNQESVMIAEDGFNFCLPRYCEFEVTAVKERYIGQPLRLSTKGREGSKAQKVEIKMELVQSAEEATVLSEGSVIVLDNLYYEFNQSFIQAGSTRELENLAEMMRRYSTLEIELSSHTDARGQKQYNLDLSMQRAQTAKQFLVSRGIEESRIKAIGYGEGRLRNHCADGVQCSEQEHQFNRRTEVKVLKLDAAVEVRYRD
ncbi:MAG: OmpA family protein [Bacteroidota bacterium]